MGERLFKLLLVREPERRQVVYFFLLFIIIGMTLALGRGTKNALFLKRYGIEFIPVMYVLLSLVLTVVTTAYAAYVDRLPSERFFRTLLLSIGGLTALSWLLMTVGQHDVVYPFYYLVHEVGAELLIVHSALYLSQNFNVLQLQRLTPVVMAGIPIGSIFGGALLLGLSPLLGVQNILLVSLVISAAGVLLAIWWHTNMGTSPHYRPGRKGGNQWRAGLGQVRQGLRLIGRYRLVTASYCALFFMGIALTVLWYVANSIYTTSFDDEAELSAFFGLLTIVTSTIALLLQAFIVNRAIRRVGVKVLNLLFPATTLVSFFGLLLSSSLWPAMLATFNKDVVMVAFRNPVRNLFFSALPAQVQGRARALSIALVMPLALLVSGLMLWQLQALVDASILLALGSVCAVLYLVSNLFMNRAYVDTILNNLKQRLLLPGDETQADLKGGGEAVFAELAAGVRHTDSDISVSFARSLVSSFPQRAAEVILQRLEDADDVARDQLLKLVAPLSPAEAGDYLWAEVGRGDAHLQATALRDLFQLQDRRAVVMVDGLLAQENPRLVAAGIYGVLCCSLTDKGDLAKDAWRDLLASSQAGEILSGLELFVQCDTREVPTYLGEGYEQRLMALGQVQDKRIQLAVLKALTACENDLSKRVADLPELLRILSNHDDTDVREACIPCYRLLPAGDLEAAILEALEDSSPEVRDSAMELLNDGSLSATGKISKWLIHENRGSPRAQAAMINSLLQGGVSARLMEQIAISKIRYAQILARAREVFLIENDPFNAVNEVMTHALRERYLQVVDLALLAMQSLEDPDSINIVREGLVSRDPRYFAIAVDAIRHFRHSELAIPISQLMAAEPDEGDDVAWQQWPFADRTSMLKWCSQRLDPWLCFCANEALSPS